MPVKLTSEPVSRTRRIRFGALAKAMKNAANPAGERFELRERVIKGRQRWWMTQFSPGSAAISSCCWKIPACFSLCKRASISAAEPPGFSARQTVVVEADFTNGGRLWDVSPVRAVVGEYRPVRSGHLTDASRRRRNAREAFGQLDCAPAAFEVGAEMEIGFLVDRGGCEAMFDHFRQIDLL